MWTILEIKTEMELGKCKPNLQIKDIQKKCKDNNVIMTPRFGSDGVYLGIGISDKDCKTLFGLA